MSVVSYKNGYQIYVNTNQFNREEAGDFARVLYHSKTTHHAFNIVAVPSFLIYEVRRRTNAGGENSIGHR